MGEVDKVLKQFGVRGMHWGIRNTKSSGSGTGLPDDGLKVKIPKGATQEAARAAALKTIAKKKGTQALTNDQLNELGRRLDAERKYNDWAKNNKSGLEAAKAFVAKELKDHGINRVETLAGRDNNKLVSNLLREAVLSKPSTSGTRKNDSKTSFISPVANKGAPKHRLGDTPKSDKKKKNK